MLVKKHLISASVVLLCALTSMAQTDDSPQRAAVRTPQGARFIWNQPGNNFTLDIRGNDVRPNNSTTDVYFKADGTVIQIQVAAIGQFVSASDRPDNRKILIAHRDWEAQHAETILGNLTVTETTDVKLETGRQALFWKFAVPEKFAQVGKTSEFLTTVNGNYVIVVAANAADQSNEERVRQVLVNTLLTLKVSDKPFELPGRP